MQWEGRERRDNRSLLKTPNTGSASSEGNRLSAQQFVLFQRLKSFSSSCPSNDHTCAGERMQELLEECVENIQLLFCVCSEGKCLCPRHHPQRRRACRCGRWFLCVPGLAQAQLAAGSLPPQPYPQIPCADTPSLFVGFHLLTHPLIHFFICEQADSSVHL